MKQLEAGSFGDVAGDTGGRLIFASGLLSLKRLIGEKPWVWKYYHQRVAGHSQSFQMPT